MKFLKVRRVISYMLFGILTFMCGIAILGGILNDFEASLALLLCAMPSYCIILFLFKSNNNSIYEIKTGEVVVFRTLRREIAVENEKITAINEKAVLFEILYDDNKKKRLIWYKMYRFNMVDTYFDYSILNKENFPYAKIDIKNDYSILYKPKK